ncbi:uncharacterized protein LOC100183762 [Ciona intestinalis]
MLQYKQLLQLCIKGLNSFHSESQSVEEHIKEFLKCQKGLDSDDHLFIVEVFSGCVQYHKLLQVVVDGFFCTDGLTSLKSDTSLYQILCYFLMFRLDEIRPTNFNKFLATQQTNKMHRFLNFFLKDENLFAWIYDEWCKLYESSFIDEIIKRIVRWKPELDNILIKLDAVVNNTISTKKPKTPTKPVSFTLSQPKPRSIPLPEQIPKLPKQKPVSTKVFREPKEVKEIEMLKQQNKVDGEIKLLEANEYQFQCANTHKSYKTREIIKNIRDEEEKKLDFNKRNAQPAPKHKVNKPIKMNAAAILREGSLFQKKEKAELQKLENLLCGAKDESEFVNWQKSVQQEDKDKEMRETEYRRVLGKLSHEEAILARQNQIKENQVIVSQLKSESAKMMKNYLVLRLEEERHMRALVEQIIEGHHNAQDAKCKLKEYKRKIVQEVNAESREMMKIALEEAEAEMRRKTELIQHIRAAESVPITRQKLVDLTATAGHALLSEMSIAELQERLSLLREAQNAEEENRRDMIIQSKQAKNENIMETIARISVHRNELSKAASIRAEEKQLVKKERAEKLKQDKTLQYLETSLQEKKEERIRRANEAKIKPNNVSAIRTRSLIREKKQLEKTRWRQLEMGQQRMAEKRTFSAPANQRNNAAVLKTTVATN